MSVAETKGKARLDEAGGRRRSGQGDPDQCSTLGKRRWFKPGAWPFELTAKQLQQEAMMAGPATGTSLRRRAINQDLRQVPRRRFHRAILCAALAPPHRAFPRTNAVKRTIGRYLAEDDGVCFPGVRW